MSVLMGFRVKKKIAKKLSQVQNRHGHGFPKKGLCGALWKDLMEPSRKHRKFNPRGYLLVESRMDYQVHLHVTSFFEPA